MKREFIALILMLFIGLIVFGVWLARLQFHRDYQLYDILFTGPVRGLSEGGEVSPCLRSVQSMINLTGPLLVVRVEC